MAAINQVITLGIGSPSGIAPFITVGFQLGSAAVTVPDVVGASQASGTSTLQGAGFVVAVQSAYSGSVASGLIISQDPTAGSSAASGSTVIIVVSLGTPPANVGQPRNKRRRGMLNMIWGR